MVALAGAAAITAAGSVYAGHQQKKAQDSANRATQMQVERSRRLQKRQQTAALREGQIGIRDATQAFDKAEKSTAGLGAAARRSVLRREKSSVESSDATAINRGLYNTTRATGARRAISADTNLALSQIDESVALAQSTIQRDRARVLLQARQNQSAIYTGFAGMGTSTIMAPTHVAGNQAGIGAGLSSLGQLLGMYAAMNIGSQGRLPSPGIRSSHGGL